MENDGSITHANHAEPGMDIHNSTPTQWGASVNRRGLDKKYNLETALYIGNSQKLNEAFSIDYGLRFSYFQYLGPGTAYFYNDTIPGYRKSVSGSKKYASGETNNKCRLQLEALFWLCDDSDDVI